MMATRKIWLDADPGHDDAIALLLALHLPNVELVGVSTVHGNASQLHTMENAARVLCSVASPETANSIPLVQGANVPLVREPQYAPAIHGEDGLGGVEGLLSASDAPVKAKMADATTKICIIELAKACEALKPGEKLNLVATGSLTNVALFLSAFPELARNKLEQIVWMGGAEGRGNWAPLAEFNAICDPEAVSIVFNFDIKVVMMPLNITHTALFRRENHLQLLTPSFTRAAAAAFEGTLPEAATPVRRMLSTLLSFFAQTYDEKFGFKEGPPVHDPLCVAYVVYPELFKCSRKRVDVELHGTEALGAVVVDIWDYKKGRADMQDWPEKDDDMTPKSWGRHGKNVLVAEELDVPAFWDLFLDCVAEADKVSVLNKG